VRHPERVTHLVLHACATRGDQCANPTPSNCRRPRPNSLIEPRLG
jgi:hypothetical protein